MEFQAEKGINAAILILAVITPFQEVASYCACPYIYLPVCGTDGKTYSNDCSLKCEGVGLAHEGSCTATKDLVQTKPTEGPRTCSCITIYRPVCGTNGKTYSNDCSRKCEGIAIAHRGKCTTADQQSKTAKKVCFCPWNYLPVCGTNGKTYSNDCSRKCEGAGVGLAHGGSCTAAKNLPPVTPAESCACPYIYLPVCGTDGKTYSNDCERKCAGVGIAGEGSCTLTRDLPPVTPAESCACPYIYLPVCGTNGKTYPNNCERKCAGVGSSHDGSCAAVGGLEISAASTKPCKCNKMYIPVCGTDGKTYKNDCERKCKGAQLAHEGKCVPNLQPGLTPAPTGTCACPMNYSPVCGRNGKTYPNDCARKCEGVSLEHRGKCGEALPGDSSKKSCACPFIYRPVCGTDGMTYSNDCVRKCEGVPLAYNWACNTTRQKPLRPVLMDVKRRG